MKYLSVISAASLIALPGALGQECVGQGVGSCQFVMESWTDIGDSGFPVTLYNHACETIGYLENVQPGQAIDSQLPYTVDVTARGGAGSQTYAIFNYAGGTYGSGHSSYVTGDCSQGLTGCSWFRSAFPCLGF